MAAARLGARVTFSGAVGDDDLGPSALAELRAEGIDVRAVVVPGATTGVALICVDPSGENQIAVAPGANAELDARRVDAALAGLDAVAGGETTGGVYLANLEITDDALLAGARVAARGGLQLVVNAAPARPLPAELLAMAPLLVANAGEAMRLTDTRSADEAAGRLAALTGRPAVVTFGAEGALLAAADRLVRVPAQEVEAVDTVGAGDCFAGAFAAELAAGASVERAVRFAVLAASLSVTRPGARGGMPALAEMWRAGWDSNPGHED